jgi:hypothetical protein
MQGNFLIKWILTTVLGIYIDSVDKRLLGNSDYNKVVRLGKRSGRIDKVTIFKKQNKN